MNVWRTEQFISVNPCVHAVQCEKCGQRLSIRAAILLCEECRKIPCGYCGVLFYSKYKKTKFCGRDCSTKGQGKHGFYSK